MTERKLVIHNLETYAAAKQFELEQKIENQNSLTRQIDRLMTGHYYKAEELHISDDGCKHSFRFWFTRDNKYIGFAGGIICHNIGEETYTVTLSDKKEPYWCIHT